MRFVLLLLPDASATTEIEWMANTGLFSFSSPRWQAVKVYLTRPPPPTGYHDTTRYDKNPKIMRETGMETK
jgi:hypothetical protein